MVKSIFLLTLERWSFLRISLNKMIIWVDSIWTCTMKSSFMFTSCNEGLNCCLNFWGIWPFVTSIWSHYAKQKHPFFSDHNNFNRPIVFKMEFPTFVLSMSLHHAMFTIFVAIIGHNMSPLYPSWTPLIQKNWSRALCHTFIFCRYVVLHL